MRARIDFASMMLVFRYGDMRPERAPRPLAIDGGRYEYRRQRRVVGPWEDGG